MKNYIEWSNADLEDMIGIISCNLLTRTVILYYTLLQCVQYYQSFSIDDIIYVQIILNMLAPGTVFRNLNRSRGHQGARMLRCHTQHIRLVAPCQPRGEPDLL